MEKLMPFKIENRIVCVQGEPVICSAAGMKTWGQLQGLIHCGGMGKSRKSQAGFGREKPASAKSFCGINLPGDKSEIYRIPSATVFFQKKNWDFLIIVDTGECGIRGMLWDPSGIPSPHIFLLFDEVLGWSRNCIFFSWTLPLTTSTTQYYPKWNRLS